MSARQIVIPKNDKVLDTPEAQITVCLCVCVCVCVCARACVCVCVLVPVVIGKAWPPVGRP